MNDIEWIDAQFHERNVNENAKKYHKVLSKYNVSLKEARMINFCTAYIDMDKEKWFYDMLVETYDCSYDEAELILIGCNWSMPGYPHTYPNGVF